MKNKIALKEHLACATSEYAYERKDANINVLAVISCEDGWSDIHIIETTK